MNSTAASLQRVSAPVWTLADSYCFIATFAHGQHGGARASLRHGLRDGGRRHFHDYFVTHLPSSSLHPDSRPPVGSYHKLPRQASTPHTSGHGPSPATVQGLTRETTVVRIPLRSAKHHFGASVARGTRPTIEDTYQAGVIELPAFAKRAPLSLTIGRNKQPRENRAADSASGDPQVFYFAVFDGHGGTECSTFLRDSLHEYIQDAAADFELQSSLRKMVDLGYSKDEQGIFPRSREEQTDADENLPVIQEGNRSKIGNLEKSLVTDWKDLVGGYFRRFRPKHFSYFGDKDQSSMDASDTDSDSKVPIEEVLEYAFLRADYDFVSAQASKKDDDSVAAEKPLNEGDILDRPSRMAKSMMIGGTRRFKGGSTGSVVMISTPTPTPFWNPSSPCSMLVSHVGDTRVLLCSTATGEAIPLTTNHHPSSPVEGSRLRRYAATFVTDSFGEERMSGLANTRAFGDIQSKRIGISAEPEIRRVEVQPAEYSFLVLLSDGVSGTLSDQEVVDIVKEARTPEQAARDVVSFATEVSTEGDNATCLVVRLGGWERRLEGHMGSMGTKEIRDWKRQEATDPRRGRT